MACFRADVDSIFDRRGPDLETTPVELPKDTVNIALFTLPDALPKPHEYAKRHGSF